MKGVLEMKVVDLIKRLQSYPMDASVSIEGDMLRVADYTSCGCSPAYIKVFGANTDRLISALDGDLEGH